jgi:predicted MFS family arabinose efflux permease
MPRRPARMAAAAAPLKSRRLHLSPLVERVVGEGAEPRAATGWREPFRAARSGRQLFIAGLGMGQIASWGTLYYSFALIAERMGHDLGLSKPEVYGAATIGLLIASFTSYPVGVAIDRGYGRAIMALGSGLAGLLLLVWSQIASLWPLYPLLAGVGLAQAMTLYEPAFAVVARRYGSEARRGITALTLWGGFASTVFVPLIQWLLNAVDWRTTLVALGLINIGLCLPLYLVAINPRLDAPSPAPASVTENASPLMERPVRWALGQPAFWGLLVAFTVYYGMFSGLSYHLYSVLLERGLDSTTVVAVIALIGPAQVAGRIVVWRFAERASVRNVGRAVVLAFPVAIALLLLLPPGFASLAVFAVIYGAANGVITIVRGIAVPEMLTRNAYGAINSVLAIPATIARAVSPLGIALLWAATGSYDSVLVTTLIGSGLVVAGFWFAAAQATRNKRAAAI